MRRAWLGVVTAGFLAGCGGHHGGGGNPTAPVSSDAPLLSSPAATFGGACTVPGTSLPGTGEIVTVSYTDVNGDLRGGTAREVTTSDDGQTLTLSGPIPSLGITITGTTSGQLTLVSCLHFGSQPTRVTETVTVTDVTGNTSNDVSVTVNRPAGAPERLHS